MGYDGLRWGRDGMLWVGGRLGGEILCDERSGWKNGWREGGERSGATGKSCRKNGDSWRKQPSRCPHVPTTHKHNKRGSYIQL